MMLIKNNLIIIFIIMAIVLEVKSYAEEVWKITSLNWEPYSGAELINQGNSVQKLREL
jgi:polar amino acid transport system substrate-binding protein